MTAVSFRAGWRRRRPLRLALRVWILLAIGRSEAPSHVDAHLVERARRGDAKAFVDLIRQYEPRLRALAYRLLNDRDLTDDVLQEAYVRAFKSLGRFRGDASLGTWLYRITYNTCIDELRRGRKVVSLFPETESEPVDARSGPEELAVERGDLAAALASLPPELRAAVILVDADGLDYAAAGEVLGVPAGTVGSRLNKARAVLRTALGVTG
jgi:RNA polymerase sigma-70 factor (ECF subfamily)